MNNIMGISSLSPCNQKLKNGYTLLDWTLRQQGIPAFWGRSLLGQHVLSPEEIRYLHGKGIKIMLTVDSFTEQQVSATDGIKDALTVIKAAKALGVPTTQNIALLVNFYKDWSMNHNWMIGFAKTLHDNGYVPGFMGNIDSSLNFNFDRQTSHFIQATENVHQFDAVYCATEPKVEGKPADWNPYCPSALQPEHIHLWCCGTNHFDTTETNSFYARDEKVLSNLW